MDEQRLPKRTRAHVLETLSRQHVESIFPPEWVHRRVEDDYGLDLRVEIVAGESVSGREFAVQLKGTDRLRTSGEDVLHSCKVSTAHYFLHRPEPVMYVVYNAQEDTAYWLWVQPYLRGLDDASPGWRERKEVGIRIPRANRLTREAVPLIADYVQTWWARVMAVVGQEYPASPETAPRPFQLPPDLVTFTGRDTYLDDLDGLLRPGAGRRWAWWGCTGRPGWASRRWRCTRRIAGASVSATAWCGWTCGGGTWPGRCATWQPPTATASRRGRCPTRRGWRGWCARCCARGRRW